MSSDNSHSSNSNPAIALNAGMREWIGLAVFVREVAERAFTRSIQIVGIAAAIILLALSVVFFALVRRGR
jgi:hypothetical protein